MSELDKNKEYKKYKNLLDELVNSKTNKDIENKEKTIKIYKKYLEIIENYYNKNIISNNKYLYYSDKYEIFNEIKNESDISLVRMGSENKLFVKPESHFGIWGSHRYDFIKCIKENEKLFFHLWNPHGYNPNHKNNIYNSEVKDINKINFDGFQNGNIILSFDRFIIPFRRIVYQNKKDIKKIFNKFKSKDAFDALGPVKGYLFFHIFGFNFEVGLTLLWLRIFHSKGKDIKTIFLDLMSEIGLNKEINNEKMIWFLYIWDTLKNEIIKESENFMNKKLNSIDEIDSEKIKNILYEENEKSNVYLVHIIKCQNTFIKEKLTEIRKELEPFIKKITEEFIEEKRRRQKEEEEERERRERERREREYEERRRRQREEEKRKRESYQYEIRTKLCNKNLDGVSLRRNDHVHIWDVHHGNNQKFRKLENDDGSVTFVNGNKAIDVREAKVHNGNAIQIFDKNYTAAQKFYIKDRGEGWVSIHSALNKRYCLDVDNFGRKNGTKVILWEYKKNDNDNQLFKLV